jgi:hypothetical protein
MQARRCEHAGLESQNAQDKRSGRNGPFGMPASRKAPTAAAELT